MTRDTRPGSHPQLGGPAETRCSFCAIARGEDTSVELVCQAEEWVAFFPTEPATPGHTLVIPRKHVIDVWELDPALACKLMSAVVVVGRAIETALQPEGMNLISSAGAAAEQTVPHVHLHVVPRWRADRIGRIWPPQKPMPHAVREGFADRIREECLAIQSR